MPFVQPPTTTALPPHPLRTGEQPTRQLSSSSPGDLSTHPGYEGIPSRPSRSTVSPTEQASAYTPPPSHTHTHTHPAANLVAASEPAAKMRAHKNPTLPALLQPNRTAPSVSQPALANDQEEPRTDPAAAPQTKGGEQTSPDFNGQPGSRTPGGGGDTLCPRDRLLLKEVLKQY